MGGQGGGPALKLGGKGAGEGGVVWRRCEVLEYLLLRVAKGGWSCQVSHSSMLEVGRGCR